MEDRQLNLFEEMLRTEEKQYQLSREVVTMLRGVRFILSAVKSTEGVDDAKSKHYDRLNHLKENLEEVEMRTLGMFVVVSKDLPKFKSKSMQEIMKLMTSTEPYSNAYVLSFDDAHDLYHSMRFSIIATLESVYSEFKRTEKSPDARYLVFNQKTKITELL